MTTDRVVVVRPFVLNGMYIPYQAGNENHNRCVFGLVKLGFARTLAMLLMMLALFLFVFWTPCVKQRKQSHTKEAAQTTPVINIGTKTQVKKLSIQHAIRTAAAIVAPPPCDFRTIHFRGWSICRTTAM